jgi:hypothetical protein
MSTLSDNNHSEASAVAINSNSATSAASVDSNSAISDSSSEASENSSEAADNNLEASQMAGVQVSFHGKWPDEMHQMKAKIGKSETFDVFDGRKLLHAMFRHATCPDNPMRACSSLREAMAQLEQDVIRQVNGIVQRKITHSIGCAKANVSSKHGI